VTTLRTYSSDDAAVADGLQTFVGDALQASGSGSDGEGALDAMRSAAAGARSSALLAAPMVVRGCSSAAGGSQRSNTAAAETAWRLQQVFELSPLVVAPLVVRQLLSRQVQAPPSAASACARPHSSAHQVAALQYGRAA
jgi:hypothetical protein